MHNYFKIQNEIYNKYRAKKYHKRWVKLPIEQHKKYVIHLYRKYVLTVWAWLNSPPS